MRYLLMMHAADILPPKDLEASFAYMVQVTEELFESGELVSTEGLTSPKQAKIPLLNV